MNKKYYSKEYVGKIKAFLPLSRKEEKAFFSTMQRSIEEYCINEDITGLNDIYKEFGDPQEAAFNYLCSIDSNELIPAIESYNRAKHISIGICISIFTISIILLLLSGYVYKEAISSEVSNIVTVLSITEN